jgi:pyridoxamine 5'-phosphate oxidase
MITSHSTFGHDPAGPDSLTPEPDPIRLLRCWLPENTDDLRPLMQLSTIDVDGYPDARSVLVSEVDDDGLYFHTSANSRKARQLAAAPRACAVLAWPEVGRQLVVQGDVEVAPTSESDSVYRSRGRYLQLLAWTNTVQTAQLPLAERRSRWAGFADQHPDGSLQPPESWIGFLIRPRRLTFWRADDLGPSQRTEYRRSDIGWLVELLDG